jgi:putative DNA primase/helicase
MQYIAPPRDLADLSCWLVWRLIHKADKKKPLKVPFYVNGTPRGQQNTEADRAQLVTYAQALATVNSGGYDGVGFAVLQGGGIIVLDFDDCVEDGRIAPHVEQLCEGTYTEFSPSGNGIHAVFSGSLMSRKDVDCKHGAFPVEVFGHTGFVTFTGRVTETCTLFGWDGQVAALTPAVLEMYSARGWNADQEALSGPTDALMALQPTLDISLGEVAATLQRIDPGASYEDWLKIGMGVHQQTHGSEEGFEIFHRWSQQSDKYDGEKECRRKWTSFGKNSSARQLTFASVIKIAKEAETLKKYEAVADGKRRIRQCADVMTLRERVCAEISRDTRIGELEREDLAQALFIKLDALGSKLPIKMCRDLLCANNSRTFETVDGEAADVLNARMLADMMTDSFVYEHNGVGWRRWYDGVWRRCGLGEEVERSKDLSAHIISTRGANVSARGADDLLRQADRANMLAGVKAALELSRSDPRIAVAPEQFDDDPEVLNTKNGLLHLQTGTLYDHHPSQRVARQCNAIYDANAKCPGWEKFMREISLNDPEWVDFIQRACGYTLTGRVGEEVMFFMLGGGANGKSVMADVMSPLLGSYATAVPAAFLATSKRDGEAATPSLATLPGARLALANEVEAGSRLSAQTVKIACSTERIVARHNHGKPFSFVPTHKLWVRGNHKPIITDNDDGIWRRIVLIPFEHRVAAEAKDLDLAKRLLREEAAGILAWMVRGYEEYRDRGLRMGGRIAAASSQYRKESDLMGQWLEERAAVSPEFEVPEPDAYADYRMWCEQQGLRPMTKKSFTSELVGRGMKQLGQLRGGGGPRPRFYGGFRLIGSYFPESDPSTSDLTSLF